MKDRIKGVEGYLRVKSTGEMFPIYLLKQERRGSSRIEICKDCLSELRQLKSQLLDVLQSAQPGLDLSRVLDLSGVIAKCMPFILVPNSWWNVDGQPLAEGEDWLGQVVSFNQEKGFQFSCDGGCYPITYEEMLKFIVGARHEYNGWFCSSLPHPRVSMSGGPYAIAFVYCEVSLRYLRWW